MDDEDEDDYTDDEDEYKEDKDDYDDDAIGFVRTEIFSLSPCSFPLFVSFSVNSNSSRFPFSHPILTHLRFSCADL